MKIDPKQKISDEEYLIGRYNSGQWTIFVTNQRIAVADTFGGFIPILGPIGIVSNLMKYGITSLRSGMSADVTLYKEYIGKFNFEIPKKNITKIVVGKKALMKNFTVIDDKGKEFLTVDYFGDMVPFLREFYPEALEIKI